MVNNRSTTNNAQTKEETSNSRSILAGILGGKYLAASIFWFLLIISKKNSDNTAQGQGPGQEPGPGPGPGPQLQSGGGKNKFKFSNYFKLFLITSIILFFYRFTYLFFINLKNKY